MRVFAAHWLSQPESLDQPAPGTSLCPGYSGGRTYCRPDYDDRQSDGGLAHDLLGEGLAEGVRVGVEAQEPGETS